jgi:SAM-dependent methyltransferase
VARTEVRAGERVLDVACGTGNAAVQAAQAGADVVGLDLSPELFPAARRRAAEAAVNLELVEGDAEHLPFAEAEFDVVLSVFGAMFAPSHARAATEMARVLRPGGRIGLASWTPDGTAGAMLATIERHLRMPAGAQRPLLWGTEPHVRAIFAGTGIDLAFDRARIPARDDIEVQRGVEFYLRSFGPIVAARVALEPDGRWDALEFELRPAVAMMLVDPPEYLVVVGTKAAVPS